MLAQLETGRSSDIARLEAIASRVLAASGGDRAIHPGECRRLAACLAGSPELWRDLIVVDSEERWSTRLFLGENIDCWLLAWHAAQDTEWHDHGGSSGGYVVTEGTLREVFRQGDCPAPVAHFREAGSSFGFGAGHIHDMGHVLGAPAVSLHVYSPPLTRMTYYDITSHGFRARETVSC
jgi:hypothetical protein